MIRPTLIRPTLTLLATALAATVLLAACAGSTTTADSTASPVVASTEADTTAPATTAPASTAPAQSALSVTDAWVRTTEGSEMTDMTAAFMTILNDGDTDVHLVSATAGDVPMVEIHEVVTKDGQSVMQPKAGGISVPAGGFATLAPGGDHVMLMGLKAPIAIGSEVALTLTFDDGETLDVVAPVKEFTEDMEHYHTEGTDPNHTH